mmetsp:Transcript_16015/g.48617  ORF Transcript_16015/g.48617 Transcript_16015/m.48617 type:complete len:108 (+) Transcript_16015:1931-2254(+)|eukprot:scaffold263402_cov32-Tisochrysis_lutea.AAC.1
MQAIPHRFNRLIQLIVEGDCFFLVSTASRRNEAQNESNVIVPLVDSKRVDISSTHLASLSPFPQKFGLCSSIITAAQLARPCLFFPKIHCTLKHTAASSHPFARGLR